MHSCGLQSDGLVACWGHNFNSQASPPGWEFRSVTAGGEHSCGIKIDGDLACWGLNDDGQATPP